MPDENLKTTDPRDVPEDGGPAFPVSQYVDGDGYYRGQRGMALRDYFAAHAMNAEISGRIAGMIKLIEMATQAHDEKILLAIEKINDALGDEETLGESCYKSADRMLEARKS